MSSFAIDRIIFVFGPSCSGKSTLCRALQRRLGDLWIYLDRDQLIEEGLCDDTSADALLENKLRDQVIVDAQIPWRKRKDGEFYCLLLPTLETLLQRDALRTLRLQRSERRAHYAREYVIHTYNTLLGFPKEDFNVCIDSSILSDEDAASKIMQLLMKFQ